HRPRPVVVGAGPAGLMAGVALAEAGLRPVLFERGEAVAERRKSVQAFWSGGVLNEESNALFGEGGAGLFSDGKLTSRSKDRPRLRRFLETLVRCGAPADILIDAEPHLGSDQLAEIVPRLRHHMIEMGGEVHFNHRMDQIEVKSGALVSITVNGTRIPADHCVVATGHSARDIYRMFAAGAVPLEGKPFAIGVRLELPQSVINHAQWRQWASHPRLGAASFKLTRKEELGFRPCYTFCMCPGGIVFACASSRGMLTTNGMSFSRRDTEFGNAAFLAPVRPDDIPATPDDDPAVLDGYKFQETIEREAFHSGGADYGLPACRLSDFLAGTVSADLPTKRSVQRAVPADIRKILPAVICDTLAHAIPRMLQQLSVSAYDEVLLYAAETRSSSPIRITRNREGYSTGVYGLIPCGEGAGYAGGIVSAGIDGLKAAETIIKSYG
ncbi:MAG: FAD-dependent oxidoreductase, partial [bacterium]